MMIDYRADFLVNKSIKITDFVNFNASYIFEQYINVIGKLFGYGFVGCYSTILENTKCYNSLVGRFCTIGENVTVGYKKINTKLFSNNYFCYGDLAGFGKSYFYKKIMTSRYFYERDKYTFIGNDVYVGNNAIIEEGVFIGNGAVVLPNSYVNEDVPDYAIVGGSPAKVINYRFSQNIIDTMLKTEWWKYDFSALIEKNI